MKTKKTAPKTEKPSLDEPDRTLVRAIRVELIKPLDERWEDVGPLLRTIAKATPILMNAAMDVRIACAVVGGEAVKAKVAPDTKGKSPQATSYQAIASKVTELRAWGEKKGSPFASLELPGSMASSMARAVGQAFSRRDQGRVRFASERVLLRGNEVALTRVGSDIELSVKLRPKGATRFLLASSRNSHRDTLRAIADGTIAAGDCKLQWDEARKKWYGLIAYKTPPVKVLAADPSRALIVHRGVRNALYVMTTTGQTNSLSGSKFFAQRHALSERIRQARRIEPAVLGSGAKGHGKSRRFATSSALEDKIARVTHTFCQQAAAWLDKLAETYGCGLVVIEDYGGIAPNEDRDLRRLLDKFPLYELKQCIASRLERSGRTLIETSSSYISTTCPSCETVDARSHDRRRGTFRCVACEFTRPADFVAAMWMLRRSGVATDTWDARLSRGKEFAEMIRNTKEVA